MFEKYSAPGPNLIFYDTDFTETVQVHKSNMDFDAFIILYKYKNADSIENVMKFLTYYSNVEGEDISNSNFHQRLLKLTEYYKDYYPRIKKLLLFI